MCTVTYIPTTDGFYLTSNRDEHHSRGAAIAPAIHKAGDSDVLYPKDPDKNGSWIAAKANGNFVVLLNGAFVKHIAKPAYKISRGSIVLGAIAAARPDLYFKEACLSDVEPFTLVIYTNRTLYECRWDGARKFILPLDQHIPHIWSSATLYDQAARAKKAMRFKSWLNSGAKKNSRSIIDLHRTECLNGAISTVSITQIQATPSRTMMSYDDLKTGTLQLRTLTVPAAKIRWLSFRIFLVKLFNWEYWPYYLVYTPVAFYWFWLSIKSRSIFFFNTANPGMKNGGFALDSKNHTYAHIPPQYCPKTILVKAGSPASINEMPLPLIAKPDIGQRGLQVKLLRSKQGLADYADNSKVDFLLQEYINYPHEAGIFYCRRPGSHTGAITSIVGKELMSVTGDGHATLQELLAKNPRYLLQVPALTKTDSRALQRVLLAGEVCRPAPYGNHSRGAKFIDLSEHVTPELVKNVHAVCARIPGFYYGRLDVKYRTWPELCAGKFMIIEVNGAASEPAHMYDPKHSIFFAWKEIKRHWDLLYKISRLNAATKRLPLMGAAEGLKMLQDHTRYLKRI